MTARRRHGMTLLASGWLSFVAWSLTVYGLGIGMQTGIPIGGFFSVRDWITPTIGIEAIVHAAGDSGELEGQATGRLLAWNARRRELPSYMAAGLTRVFPEGDWSVSAVAGVEFDVASSEQIVWNLEAGVAYEVSSGFGLAIGFGIHFYFSRP